MYQLSIVDDAKAIIAFTDCIPLVPFDHCHIVPHLITIIRFSAPEHVAA